MTKCIKYKCSINTKTKPEQGHTPIIAVTWEAETREFQVQGQSQQLHETLSQNEKHKGLGA